jgi:hypothetical protein
MKTEQGDLLDHHPAAELMPDMDEEEYAALIASIKEHGQEVPILLLKGKILDSRHRYRACCELGIEPAMTEIDTDDPVNLVLTLNLNRRHLSKGQKAIIAARITARNKPGRPDPLNAKNSQYFKTTQEAADTIKVHRKSVLSHM